jgi:hypothetical protein
MKSGLNGLLMRVGAESFRHFEGGVSMALSYFFAYAWLSPSNRDAQYIGFIQLENGDVPELGDRVNEAEWNKTTIEFDHSRAVTSLRPSSSRCSSFPAEAGLETFRVLLPPKKKDDLSATGNLSRFGIQAIQGPADCSTVLR